MDIPWYDVRLSPIIISHYWIISYVCYRIVLIISQFINIVADIVFIDRAVSNPIAELTKRNPGKGYALFPIINILIPKVLQRQNAHVTCGRLACPLIATLSRNSLKTCIRTTVCTRRLAFVGARWHATNSPINTPAPLFARWFEHGPTCDYDVIMETRSTVTSCNTNVENSEI